MRLMPVVLLATLLPAQLLAQSFYGRTRTPAFGYQGRQVAIRTAMYVPRSDPAARSTYEREHEESETPEDAPAIESSSSRPMVAGRRAILRRGIAYAPADAPDRVKRAIWAVNTLRHKPYKWGGGHGSFYDSGYDCSGTVSFALYHAGVLDRPMPSRGFLDYGERGVGRWITVYARRGHTFAVVAGLRLDTTGFYEREGPRWRTTGRSGGGFTARHPAGL